jgi:hypothetical protein
MPQTLSLTALLVRAGIPTDARPPVFVAGARRRISFVGAVTPDTVGLSD